MFKVFQVRMLYGIRIDLDKQATFRKDDFLKNQNCHAETGFGSINVAKFTNADEKNISSKYVELGFNQLQVETLSSET